MSVTENSNDLTKQPLPKGWRWVRLGDVCVQDRKIIDPSDPNAKRLPYLGLEHIESETGKIIRETNDSVELEGRSTTFAFNSSHVLYGKLRPYLNKVATPNFDGRCTTELIPLLPQNGIDRFFLAWLLRRREIVNAVMLEKNGSRMPRADINKLLALKVPLPPLPEQKRIAAILNEQMSAIEKARAAAEKQLEAAKALTSAYLREVFESEEAKKWPRKRLGEVGDIVSGVTLGRKINDDNTRLIPYLRVANVKDGYLDLTNVYEIEATETEIQKYRLEFGDILLTEGGDPDKLGRGTFWGGQIAECIHQNHIFRVRFNREQFSPQFISFQINSSYGKAYFLTHAKQTTGIATINKKVLSGFPLMLPPKDRQEQIVKTLSDQLEKVQQLQKILEDQLEAIKALPQAILRKAFVGEL